jgi:hypothetical protein
MVVPVFLSSWVACAAEDKGARDAQELHLVGIYEGNVETGNQIHGPRATVHVDRPGKHVTLVLVTYDPVTWEITPTEGTEVAKVFLGGNRTQAVKGLPAGVAVVETWRQVPAEQLRYANESNSPAYRRLARQAEKLTGLRVCSFQGAYCPDAPFKIDRVQDSPRLASTYPQPSPPGDLPPGANGLSFDAHYYVSRDRHGIGRDTSFGPYTLLGPKKASLKSVPVSRITYDPVGKTYYGIVGHDFALVDFDRGKAVPIEVGLDVPPLSWPCEVTFDTKRERVVLGSSAGGGYLYAYEPKSGKWSVISKRPGAFDAFAYSEQDDCLYGVILEYGEEGNRPFFGKVNMQGAVLSRKELTDPFLPGSLSAGPGVCTTQVVVAGDYVVVLAAPGGLDPEGGPDGWYIYLIDPKSGKAWLTAKELVAK